jgi:hypothetical protein
LRFSNFSNTDTTPATHGYAALGSGFFARPHRPQFIRHSSRPFKRAVMVAENVIASKSRGRRWLMRAVATTTLVALIVVSMAGWLYFLGKIGRAVFGWILT